MDPENEPAFEEQPGPEKEVGDDALTAPVDQEAPSLAERPQGSGQPVFMWADIFFAMLSEPEKTLAILAQSSLYEPDPSALFGSGLLVALASMIGNLADAGLEGAPPTLLELIGGLCATFFFWFCLALLLKFLSIWFRHNATFKTCAVVTGWAFLPLIFKAPFMCISLSEPFLGFLMVIPTYWFLILEMYAFDSVLKLGKVRMIVLAIAIPPLVVFTYLFWLTVSATLAIAALSTMFPNSFS
jgi:hypothetical protein